MIATQSDRRGSCMAPTDARLISDPLAFIAEEHLRLRQICSMMVGIAVDPQPEFKAMGMCLAYLRHEYLLHLADEGFGLFPAMEERCEPEDQIGIILSRIKEDQADAKDMAQGVCRALADMMESGCTANDEERTCMKTFAAKCQRYLIWENAIIMRLAQARLTQADFEQMSCQMLMRRGLIEPNGRAEV